MAVDGGKTKVEKALKQILKAEEQKGTFDRLRRLLKKDQRGAHRYIIKQEQDGTERMILDQEEINATLLERNRKHFSQADGTPFTTKPLVDLFGKYGTNEVSRALLDGELEVDSLDVSDATKAILRKLKRLAPAGEVGPFVTAEEIRKGHKVWRESTSTSPSGTHLGHEKVLFKLENSGEEVKLSDK